MRAWCDVTERDLKRFGHHGVIKQEQVLNRIIIINFKSRQIYFNQHGKLCMSGNHRGVSSSCLFAVVIVRYFYFIVLVLIYSPGTCTILHL